jgi:hypothetical protein
MGRTNYSYSGLLSSVVKDLYYRYTDYERNEDTLADRVSEDAQDSTRRDYSLYPFLQEEYNVDALRLQTLELIPPNITLIGQTPQIVLRNTQYIDPGITVDIEEYTYTADTSNINMNVAGSYDLIYKVEDYFGNISIAKRVVRVKETLDPEIILNGENPYFIEKYSSYVDPGATVDINLPYSVDYSSVDEYVLGTYTVTYSVDFDGRVITTTRQVTVIDTTPPIITLNGENPQIIDRFTSYTDEGAFVLDAGSKVISIDTSNVNTNEVGDYDVVYTAYDGTNYISIIRVVKVVDNTPPVATLNGPNPYIVERFSIYQDPDPPLTLDFGSTLISTDTSNVNTNTLGDYDVIYRVEDGSNTIFKSRVVSVVDITPPNITLEGENPYYIERFSDYQDPDPPLTLDAGSTLISTDTSNVNTNTIGDYDVIYTATDEGNNITQAVRVVKVVDNLAPVITLNGDNPFILERAVEYIDPGVVLDRGTSLVSTDTSNVDTSNVGNYDVVYEAYDGNNISYSIRTVSVIDTKPPVITLNESDPYVVEKFSTYEDPGVTLDIGSTLISTDTSNVNTNVEGFYNVVYKAYDGNNISSSIRTVLVVDRNPPSINLVGSNPLTINKNIIYNDPGITLDTGSKLISTDTSNVNTNTVGDYDVIYVVNDGKNTVTATRVVRVQNVGGPNITIQGFNPYTIERGESYYEFGALVEDNEELTIDTTELDTNVTGVYDVYYRSTKDSNTSTTIRKVIVQDTNAPVITLLGKNPDYCNLNAKYVDPGAIADTGETVKSDSTTSVDSSVKGVYTVKYEVLDISGNSSFKTRNVIVDAFPQPSLTLLGDNPQVLELGQKFIDSGVRSTENEIITDNSSNVININKIGDYEVTYTATNSYGQTAIISRTVKVVDTKTPVIYFNGENNVIRTLKNTRLIDVGAYSTEGTTVVSDRSRINVIQPGIQKIIYTTVDSSDNIYTIERPVIVTETAYSFGILGDLFSQSFGNIESSYGPSSTYIAAFNKMFLFISEDASRVCIFHEFSFDGYLAIFDYNSITNNWALTTKKNSSYVSAANENRFEDNVIMSKDGSVVAYVGGYYNEFMVVSTITTNGLQQIGNTIELFTLNNNTSYSNDLIHKRLIQISGDGQRVATTVRYNDPDTANVGRRFMIFHYNQQTGIWDVEFNHYLNGNLYAYYSGEGVVNTDMTVIFTRSENSSPTRNVFRKINNSWVDVTNTEIDVPQPISNMDNAANGLIGPQPRNIREQFSDDGNRFMKIMDLNDTVGIFEYSSSNNSWSKIGNNISGEGYKAFSGDGTVVTNYSNSDRIDIYKLYNNEWVINDSVYPTTRLDYYNWFGTMHNIAVINGDVIIPTGDYENSNDFIKVLSGGKTLLNEGDKSISMKRGTNFVDPGSVVSLTNDTVVTVTDFINANVNGIYTLIYHNASSTDQFLERELIVEDGPDIFLHGPDPYYVKTSNEYIDPGYYSSSGEIVNVFSSNVIPNVPGLYLVGYSATNSNNITNEITRRVVVEQDTTSNLPSITLSGDNPIFIELNSEYTDPGATSSDGASVQVNSSNVVTSNTGTYDVSYTTDTGGLKTRSVVVTNGPKIILLGENPYKINLNDEYIERYAYCVGGENIEIDSTGVNISEEGTYSVIYKSIDNNQNETIRVRNVIVKDEPKINLIQGSEIQINSEYVEPGVLLNGISNYDIIRDESNVNANLKNSTFICNYVYNGVDNTYKNTRAVRVIPDPSVTITSQISLYGDNPQIVKRNTMYVDPGAVSSGGETIVFNRQTLDMNTNGEYTVTYSITDSNFNRVTEVRRVVVEDPDPPTINLIGDNPLYVTRSDTQSYTDPGTSSSGGEIVYTFSNNLNISKYGEYSVFYACSNVITGLLSTTKRDVIVRDLQSPPTIELIGESTINLKYPQEYTEYGIITQNPSNLTYTYSNSNPVDINIPGTYTVTYNVVTDDARSNTISRSVIVSNDQLPNVILFGENPQKIQVGTPYKEFGAETDGNLTILINSSNVNTNLIGSYEVVYSSGNTNVIRNVVVQDKIGPIITPIGDNPLYIKRGSTTEYIDLGATSDGGEDVSIISNNVDVTKVGSYNVEYSAVDSNGNIGKSTRTVNIRNDNKPVVVKLNGGDVSRLTYGTIYNDTGIIVENSDDTIEYFEDPTLLTQRGGVNTFYRVTDKNNNTTTATKTVLIQDNFLKDGELIVKDFSYSPIGYESRLSCMSDDGNIVSMHEGNRFERSAAILKRVSETSWVNIIGNIADGYAPVCLISGDGTRCLTTTTNGTNQFNIYDYENDIWVLKLTHVYDTGNLRDCWDLKLSKDGNFIALGTNGSVEVYKIENNSGVFSLSRVGNDIVGVNSDDGTGTIIDISRNGQIVAVSEYGYDNGNGSVRIFEYLSYTDEWFLLGKRIKGEDQFGCGLALSSDGTIVAIGSTTYFEVYKFSAGGEWQLMGNRVYKGLLEPFRGTTIYPKSSNRLFMSGDGLTLGIANQDVIYKFYSNNWVETQSGMNTMVITNLRQVKERDFTMAFSYNGENVGTLFSIRGTGNSVWFYSFTSYKTYRVSPILTLGGDEIHYINQYEEYIDPGFKKGEDNEVVNVLVDSYDPNKKGIQYLKYGVVSERDVISGKLRTIFTVSQAPLITIKGDNPFYIKRYSFYVDPGAEISDSNNGFLVVDYSDVDTSIIGSYVVKYTSYTNYGKKRVAYRSVIVEENNNPSKIFIIGPNPYNIKYGDQYQEFGAVSDTGENVTIDTSNIDLNNPGKYYVTYSITNKNTGLINYVRRDIIVSTPIGFQSFIFIGSNPVIIKLGSSYIERGLSVEPTETLLVDNNSVNTNVVGKYTVEYHILNSVRTNTTQRIYKDVFVLEDPESPVITLNNSKNIFILKGTPYIEYGAKVTTDQDITIDSTEVNVDQIGIYKVYYSVVDSNNRTIQVYRNVMVTIDSSPTITLNPGITRYLVGGSYIESGYSSTSDVVVNNTVDFTSLGNYTVYYSPKDISILSDLSYKEQRNVTVIPQNAFYDVGGSGGFFTSDNSKIFSYSVQGGNRTVLYKKVSGGVWEEEANFTGGAYGDGAVNDSALSISGDGSVVAYNVSQELRIDRYSTTTNTWQNEKTFTFSGQLYLPYSVNLSEDGNTFAYHYNTRTQTSYNLPAETEAKSTSYVYIYKYINGVWTQDYTFTLDDDVFDVAMTRDATTLAFSMRYKQIRAFDYNSSNNTWVERAGSYNIPNNYARYFVCLSDSGNRFVLSPRNYICDYDYTTNSWTEIENLGTSRSAAISGDGNTIASSAYQQGRVYRYSQQTNSWPIIFTRDTSTYVNVAISKDGTLFWAGGYNVELNFYGNNYIYSLENHIKILGNNPYYMREGDTYNDPGATYIEFETGNTSSNVTVDTSNLDANTFGTYIVQYSHSSNGSVVSETRIVKVLQRNISITLNGSNPYYVEKGSNYTDPGYTAPDGISVTLDQSNLDMNKLGNYTIKYTFSDVMGGYGYTTRSVIVQKTNPYIITLLGSNPQTVVKEYVEYGVTLNDTEIIHVDKSNLVANTNGTYTVSYSVYSDDGLQSNTISRDVVVSRESIILNGSNPEYITQWQQVYTDPGSTKSAYSATSITIDTSNVNLYKNGTYIVTHSTRYFTLVPPSGYYTVYKEREVVVNIPRITTLLGEDPYYVNVNSTYVDPGVISQLGEIQVDISNLDMNTPGTYNVFYNVLDSNNNIINGTCRTVVVSGQVPILNGFNPLLVKRGDEYIEYGASVLSGDSAQVKLNDVNTSVNGTYTVNYVYTDYNGFTSNVSRQVVVSDNLNLETAIISSNSHRDFSVVCSGNGLRCAYYSTVNYVAPIIYDLKNGVWKKVYDFEIIYASDTYTCTRVCLSEDGNRIALQLSIRNTALPIAEIYDWDELNQSWILNFTYNPPSSYSFIYNLEMSKDGKIVYIRDKIFKNVRDDIWIVFVGSYPINNKCKMSHYGDKMVFIGYTGSSARFLSIYKFNGELGIEKLSKTDIAEVTETTISGDGNVIVATFNTYPATMKTYKFDTQNGEFYQIGQTFTRVDTSAFYNLYNFQLSYYGDIFLFRDGFDIHIYKFIEDENIWSSITTLNSTFTPGTINNFLFSANLDISLITYFESTTILTTHQLKV